jgi:hypothetical protein
MKTWAIRLKETDKYLPVSRGGNSYVEPTSSTISYPRLHKSKRGAQNALTAWLQGHWIQKTTGGYSYFGEPDFETETFANKKIESRKRENMEIVEFDLIEVNP